MKILYNAMQLHPPLSGIGRYASILGQMMANIDLIEEVHYFDSLNIYDNYSAINRNSSVDTNKKSVFAVANKIVQSIPFANKTITSILQKRLGYKLKEKKDFLYHETNYNFLPFEGKKISTVHDLSFIHYRDFHPTERIAYFEKEFPKTLASANHFITDAQYVKDELIGHFNIHENKITAIPLGVNENFRQFNKKESQSILKKYGIANMQYILLVGSLEPRKNLSTFIEAFNDLDKKVSTNYKIIHVGPLGWKNETLLKKLNRLEEKGIFKSLGYIIEEDLPCIYANAHTFVFPSVYEGFGFPPLEAMASGVPVLATNTSSIPEVVGEAGLLTDPYDVKKMASDLNYILTDTKIRLFLTKKGLERAKQFSWKKTVEKTLEVYKNVLN